MAGLIGDEGHELTHPLLEDELIGAPDCVEPHPDDDEDGLGLDGTEFYEWDALRWALCQLLAMLTCGLSLLIFRWCPVFALRCTHRRCSPSKATTVLSEGTDGQSLVLPILPQQTIDTLEKSSSAPGTRPSAAPVPAVEDPFSPYEPGGAHLIDVPRRFSFRHALYFQTKLGRFTAVKYRDAVPFRALVQASTSGLADAEVRRRRAFFSENLARVPVKPPPLSLLARPLSLSLAPPPPPSLFLPVFLFLSLSPSLLVSFAQRMRRLLAPSSPRSPQTLLSVSPSPCGARQVKSHLELLLDEILHPFYIFQALPPAPDPSVPPPFPLLTRPPPPGVVCLRMVPGALHPLCHRHRAHLGAPPPPPPPSY